MPQETSSSIVIRTPRGLSISGTRITLYCIMDYIKAGWPPKLIRGRLNLSDEQISGAVEYIETHREKVESEYDIVVKETEEIRNYWENRNHKRFAEIKAMPPKAGQEKIRARIQARKSELGLL